jgi:hydroxymethylpyrimidine kinase/phosphomethylpyrimidine kinase
MFQVMVSTSGSKLLPEDGIRAMMVDLLPMAYLLTPNIPEALLLLEMSGKAYPKKIESIDDMHKVAKLLHTLGPQIIFLKGGHIPMTKLGRIADQDEGVILVDVFFDGSDLKTITKPYINSKNTHGTGCSLASAIACNLAKGHAPYRSVQEASSYIASAIDCAPGFGSGSGPINHMHSIYQMPFAPYV